jgi:predicted nucleotidyltransferase
MKTKLPTNSKEYHNTIQKIKDIIIQKGGDKLASIILFGSFARGDFCL